MNDDNDNMTRICVFAASGDGIAPCFFEAAHELGTLMARRGWGCVNGAGSSGLMKAVSDGTLDAGGIATGVIPKFMVDNGWHYDRLSELIITPDMHERKRMMSSLSNAVVALPGGCGTLEELLEAITWRQLGIIDKPIVLLNTDGFFDPLVEMLERCVERGFMRPTHNRIWNVAATPAEAVDMLAHLLDNGVAPIEPARERIMK